MEVRDTRWLSVAEVADHLGVARDTVYRWIDSRGMPAHRVGRFWKFQLSEVDAWVKSGEAEFPSSADFGGLTNAGRLER